MRAYALVEIGDSQAVDLFLRREDAFAALEDALGDEPDWLGVLSVVPIELDGRDVSLKGRGPRSPPSPKAVSPWGPSAWTNQLGPCVLDAASRGLLAPWPPVATGGPCSAYPGLSSCRGYV
jgi:hypothetical protein